MNSPDRGYFPARIFNELVVRVAAVERRARNAEHRTDARMVRLEAKVEALNERTLLLIEENVRLAKRAGLPYVRLVERETH